MVVAMGGQAFVSWSVATNLAIDDALLLEAQELGGHLTRRSVVTAAGAGAAAAQ